MLTGASAQGGETRPSGGPYTVAAKATCLLIAYPHIATRPGLFQLCSHRNAHNHAYSTAEPNGNQKFRHGTLKWFPIITEK